MVPTNEAEARVVPRPARRASDGKRIDRTVSGGVDFCKAALTVLARTPIHVLCCGSAGHDSVTAVKKTPRGQWSDDKADQFLAAARDVLELWRDRGLDFEDFAGDAASKGRRCALGTTWSRSCGSARPDRAVRASRPIWRLAGVELTPQAVLDEPSSKSALRRGPRI
jgi:hypothetical protein